MCTWGIVAVAVLTVACAIALLSISKLFKKPWRSSQEERACQGVSLAQSDNSIHRARAQRRWHVENARFLARDELFQFLQCLIGGRTTSSKPTQR